jgi:hypothetical protein
MNTFRLELLSAGGALALLGLFLGGQAFRSEASDRAPVSYFTNADFDAFDRAFDLDGQACDVGFKAHRICFGVSPYETDLVQGAVLPVHVPALSAEFRVIVETDLKADHLQTVRFGRTLALIEPQTRQVHDILRLDAPDYQVARGDSREQNI